MLLERVVFQKSVSQFLQDESMPQLEGLLQKSKRTWSDIQTVYQLVECHEVLTPKRKHVKTIVLLLQSTPGKMDLKYMQGLDFLIPIPNVYKEITEWLNRGI